MGSVWCILVVYTDDATVRPVATAAEAEGANIVGLVILSATVLPFAVIIILDLVRIIVNKQHNKLQPPRKAKHYKTRRHSK